MPEPIDDLFKSQEVIDIIGSSVAKTISGYTKIEVVAQPAVLEKSALPACDAPAIEVGAAIRFESPVLSVELLLLFAKAIYLPLYTGATELAADALEPGMPDLAGEILNISFGNVDPQMRGAGFRLRSSFPQSFWGRDLELVLKSRPGRCILIPFSALGAQFYLQIFTSGTLKRKWAYTPVK